jgi:hypothetical protein
VLLALRGQRSHRKIERDREREGEGKGAKKRYIPAQNLYIIIHIMYLLADHHQSFFSEPPRFSSRTGMAER